MVLTVGKICVFFAVASLTARDILDIVLLSREAKSKSNPNLHHTKNKSCRIHLQSIYLCDIIQKDSMEVSRNGYKTIWG